MSDFKVSVEFTELGRTLILSGPIDETSNFSLLDSMETPPVVLDVENVTRVNSIGIRNWIIWINKNAKGKQLHFHNCPKVMVDQINVVHSFLPPGSLIESFKVPFACQACDKEISCHFERGVHFANGALTKVPEMKCPTCGKAAEMDADQRYFAFLKAHS